MTLDAEHLQSPAALAALAALAVACGALVVALLRARRRIRDLALTDKLTALGTRKLMERDLPREIASARREGHFLFVAVADVDRLEPYNHAFGRPAGHALLAGIGAVLRGAFRRPGDHVFRSGGDQFTFAFSTEHRFDGPFMAERVRARVEELDRRHTANVPWERVTVSIGLVRIAPGAVARLDEVEARALEALALARKEGRNRVAGLDIDGERFQTRDGIALAPRPAASPAASGAPAGRSDP